MEVSKGVKEATSLNYDFEEHHKQRSKALIIHTQRLSYIIKVKSAFSRWGIMPNIKKKKPPHSSMSLPSHKHNVSSLNSKIINIKKSDESSPIGMAKQQEYMPVQAAAKEPHLLIVFLTTSSRSRTNSASRSSLSSDWLSKKVHC